MNPSNRGLRRQTKESVLQWQHCSGQNFAVLCKKNIVVASKVAALGLLKKEKVFDPCWLAALESFASMFSRWLIINLFGKRCHYVWNFSSWVLAHALAIPLYRRPFFFRAIPTYRVIPYSMIVLMIQVYICSRITVRELYRSTMKRMDVQ